MERAKIRQLLVDHYLDFYTLAYKMLEDDDDARDAVQEALTRTMSRIKLDDPMNFCYTTLRHSAIDILRHRQRMVHIEGDFADEGQDEDAATSYATLLEEAARLRDDLPRALRSLVILHDEQGMGYDELARLTGISRMTIRRKLKKVHNMMRIELEKKKGEEI